MRQLSPVHTAPCSCIILFLVALVTDGEPPFLPGYYVFIKRQKLGIQKRNWTGVSKLITCSFQHFTLKTMFTQFNLLNTVKNIGQHLLISFTNFNAQFLYSLTTCMLHYNPWHVSSINMPIFRRTNFIIKSSGIVTTLSVVQIV